MENVIIGIHGLGNKPPKKLLENWWKKSMIEGLKTNEFNTYLPKFELVYWADILYDKALDLSEKDISNPFFLEEKYVEASNYFSDENHETREKIIDYLGLQLNRVFLNDDLSLNYTYITDAIVHRYFRDLEAYYAEEPGLSEVGQSTRTRKLIRERLITVLEKYRGFNIMLVSHSMGSIIAYDVLKFHVADIRINTFVTIGSPLGLPVIVSKIASEQKHLNLEESQVSTPAAVYGNWFNFADILDKVAFNFRLDDDFIENQHGIKPIDYLVVNNYEINNNRNPHKSFGYLRTPEFSVKLSEFVLSEKITFFKKLIRKSKNFVNRLLHPIRSGE